MGMDVAFPLKAALDAGLETEIYVEDYREYGEPAQKSCALLVVKDPVTGEKLRTNMECCAQSDGVVAGIVRANKWGYIYTPLTTFLIEHGIEWWEV